jgi:hypothetical protein
VPPPFFAPIRALPFLGLFAFIFAYLPDVADPAADLSITFYLIGRTPVVLRRYTTLTDRRPETHFFDFVHQNVRSCSR